MEKHVQAGGKRQEGKEAQDLKDRVVSEKVPLGQRPEESEGAPCPAMRERCSWPEQRWAEVVVYFHVRPQEGREAGPGTRPTPPPTSGPGEATSLRGGGARLECVYLSWPPYLKKMEVSKGYCLVHWDVLNIHKCLLRH